MAIKKSRLIRGIYFTLVSCLGYSRKKFGYLEKGVSFTPPTIISNPKNVFIYSNSDFEGCHISASNAKFVVKKGCAFGERLTVHTGNHARLIGKFVGTITEAEKPKGYDKDVVVEEDVWIGSNVTLLAGVTIGRGSTIAAGSIVTKSTLPYCIAGGVPARFIKFYWTIDEIIEHEKKLYPEEERFSREYLEKIFVENKE